MSLNVTLNRFPPLHNPCLWQGPGGRDSPARMAGVVGGLGWDRTPLQKRLPQIIKRSELHSGARGWGGPNMWPKGTCRKVVLSLGAPGLESGY